MRITILVLILFSTVSYADDAWKNEWTIYSGISFLNAENEFNPCPICESIPIPVVSQIDFTTTQSVDTSVLIGFKYGRYFNDNIEVEGNFGIAPTRDIRLESGFSCPPGEVCPLRDFLAPFFSGQENAITYYYDGNFVYNFHVGRIRPFFSAGLGGVSTDTTVGIRNDVALVFGGGAKFRFQNVGFRIEVNDRVIPDYFLTQDTQNDLQVQYGFLFGF